MDKFCDFFHTFLWAVGDREKRGGGGGGDVNSLNYSGKSCGTNTWTLSWGYFRHS